MAYSVVHFGELLDEIGEERCREIIADFSCPLDLDVEDFLKDKAITFQRMGISRSYLVFTSYRSELVIVGYFALASKVLSIRKDVSKSMLKKLTGSKNRGINTISTGLIGQLAKNFHNGIHEANLISGEILLGMAMQKLVEARHLVGGRVALVECQDNPKLKAFYEKFGFSLCGSDKNDGLLRYVRELSDVTFTWQ